MEGIPEREENSTDHVIQNKRQEIENEEFESNTEKNAEMDTVITQKMR
jgi:hypothetical protein